MYIFYFYGNHKGWYISSMVFDTEDGFSAAEKAGNILSWCGMDSQQQPTKLHMPYYAKKMLKGGTVLPYGVWAEARIAFI